MADKFHSTHLTAMRDTSNRAAQVLRNFLTERERLVQASTRHVFSSPESIQQARDETLGKVAALKRGSIDQLRELDTNFDAAHKSFLLEVAATFDGPKAADSNEMLAREIRAQQAWNRTKGILDAMDGQKIHSRIQKMAEDASAAGDHVTLSALRAELPSYFEARRLGVEVGQHIAGEIETVMAKSNPKIAAAMEARAEVESSMHRAKMAINHSVFALERNQEQAFIPAWERSGGVDQVETIQIPGISFSQGRA